MTVVIESVIGIILFTLIVVPSTIKDPLASIGDYPEPIRKRCVELGLIESSARRFTKREFIRKVIAVFVFAVIFALVLKHFNHADSFMEGFRDSYFIWLVITWYDALVLDCIWFCHSDKVKIPGTGDMKEYKDYMFHIRQSCIGTLLGIPACAMVGLLVMLF